MTICGGLLFPNWVSASNAGGFFGGSFTNNALLELGESFVALVDNPNHRGPNQETQQMVIFRLGPSSFQVLRKWLASRRNNTNEQLTLQWDSKFFDEVVSVVSNHAFSVIIPTQNILDYQSQNSNVLDEVEALSNHSRHAEKNLLLRNIKLQQALYSSISLCGIPMVVRVNAPLGNGRYSVQTYQTNDATLESSGNENGVYAFRLVSGGEERARSTFHASIMASTDSFPKVIVQSEKRVGGEWKFALAAKLFPIPDTFPTIEEVHSQLFREAFISGSFAHRDRYSNGVIYSFSKAGNPVPVSTRPVTKGTSTQSQVVLVRVLLAALFLAGLALLLRFSLKPANKNTTQIRP